jgi:hypothetical protein
MAHVSVAEYVRRAVEEQLAIEDSISDLALAGMGPTSDGWEVRTVGAHDVVLSMATSMAEMLDEKDATNYVEAEFWPAGGKRYILNVRRGNGKTPHELRQAAEAELAEVRAELERMKATP